jgi:hypothetical protein
MQDPPLTIMVSPVRIRVPPLEKVLQIAEKYRDLTELPKPLFYGLSTAGSRKGLFKRGCGGGLHAFCGADVDGEGHPVMGVSWTSETRAA